MGDSSHHLNVRRRTRASVACRLCRTRKTRCDNRRPSCGYCSMHGARCVYPDDVLDDINTVDVSNSDILEKVNRAVALLEEIKSSPSSVAAGYGSIGGSSCSPNNPPTAQRANDEEIQANQTESAFANDGFGHLNISEAAARCSACESILEWPIIASLGVEGNVRSFGLEAMVVSEPDISPRQGVISQDGLLNLCKRFLSLIHIKNPILDVAEFTSHARQAAEYGPGWDAGGCLVLLACALASATVPYDADKTMQAALDSPADEADLTAADSYYNAAQRRLGLLQTSLVAAQCQYLAGLYEKFLVRPMRAWTRLEAACTQLQAWLYARGLVVSGEQGAPDHSRTRHLEQRLYWSCMKAEWELRIDLQIPFAARFRYPDLFPYLSLPSASDLQVLDSNPLSTSPSQALTPWSPEAWQSSPGNASHPLQSGTSLNPDEERSWLHYLAEISLRSLMNRVLRGLYHGGTGSWKSASVSLSHQQAIYLEELQQWHSALPQPLVFADPIPIRSEVNNLFRPPNELAFFLQTRYVLVYEWIYRPSVFITLEDGSMARHHPGVIDSATKAVHAASTLIILIATHHRHGGIWGLLRRSFGAALVLIAVAIQHHRVTGQNWAGGPCVAPPDDWVRLVEISIITLHRWAGPGGNDLLRMQDILRQILQVAAEEAAGG